LSGKTEFTLNLLGERNTIFNNKCNSSSSSNSISTANNLETNDYDIIYFYTEFQDKFLQFQQKAGASVIFTDNFESLKQLADDQANGRNKIIVIDDALLDLKGKELETITTFFIKKCHHKQVDYVFTFSVY